MAIIIFVSGGTQILFAQQDSTQSYQPYNSREGNSESFGQRLVWGGNFGLQFGDVTVVDIEPIIGYKITQQLIGGIGIKYIYYKYKYFVPPNYLFEASTNIYGGSVFGRYYFIESFFGHVEYELLNLEVPNEFYPYNLFRKNISSVLVGGGYSQQIGEHAVLAITLLYNLTEENYTPYENPIIRIGFGFGF